MKPKPQPGREGGGTLEQRVQAQITRETALVREWTDIAEGGGGSAGVRAPGKSVTLEDLARVMGMTEAAAAAERRDAAILGWAACAPGDHCSCYADGFPCCGCGVPGGTEA